MNGSCVDIDECNAALTSCADFNNTYCVNTAGSWECRCAPGYSLGGNYEHQFENARNTSDLCLATIYSSFCENGCKEPASCSSATGRCTCPINSLQLAVSSDPTRETCRCLDHPFVYYNETECVNVSGQTWVLLHMKFKKSVRSVLINDSAVIFLENQISDILNNISISCDASCMDVFDTQDVLLPDLQLLVTLNVTMNSTDRVEFANRLFSNDIAYNESYVLVLAQIIADTATRIPENYTNVTSLTTTTLSISTQIVTEELITNTEVMFSTTFQTTEGREEIKTSTTEISTEVTKEATDTTSYMSETVIADNASTLFTLYDTVTFSSAAYVTSEIHMTDMISYSTLNGTSQTASAIAETITDVTTVTGSTDTKTTEDISEGPSSITHTNKPVPTSADIAYSATTYESITNMISNSSTIEIISSTMITPIVTETPAIISTDTSSRTAVDISETTNSIITPPTSMPSVFSDASTITNTDAIVTLVTTTTMISDTAIYTNETKTTFDVSDETSFTIIPTSSLPITLSTTNTSEIITPISTDTVTPTIMTTTIENTNFTHLSTETSEIANTSPGTTEYVTISEGTETKISTTNTNLPPTIETNETEPTIYTTVQPSPILTTTTNSMMTEISGSAGVDVTSATDVPVSTTSTTAIDTLISGSTSVDTTSSSDAPPTTPTTPDTLISESTSVDITSSTDAPPTTPSTTTSTLIIGSTSVDISFTSDTTPTTTTNAGVSSNVSTINTDFSTVSSAITSATTDIEGLTNYSIATSFSASTDITIPTTMLTNTAVHNITTANYTTTSTQTTTSSTTTTTSVTTTTSTASSQICTWTNWVPLSNCTPSCGIAYRLEVRSCIDFTIGQSCHSDLCGGGNAIQNTSCTYSPPCPTLPIIPQPSIRDPKVRINPYLLPDAMYFFEQTYRRIWISNKGYITFGTPFYSRTMTTSTFGQISQQAIAAPFWTDLLYDNRSSVMTINWFSSTNASESDVQMYSEIIQSAINSACPTTHCSSQFAAARVVRIHWQNLVYELTNVSQSMNISFAAYLINTYEYASYYSQPVLRSYIAYDYSELPDRLSSIRPFVGYRGKREMMKVFNDPSYQRNAPFLTHSDKTRRRQSFYAGGRFLTDCEVTHLQQARFNILNPAENLNDVINNPRFPCPCTLAQAQIDRRFGRLFSETAYETSQHVICYGPMTNNWIRFRWTTKLLRSQTCCYNRVTRDLITSGYLAGSVLSNGQILFNRHPSQRRITFYDQCCAPSRQDGIPNWQRCRLYYQLHPASSCTGYRAPAIVSGVGDPHVNTIDNGRYTCHIQGLYVFAQTTDAARVRAENNAASNVSDVNLIYPDDLFRIYVRSVMVSPVLAYIERTQGYGSIFTSYTIITDSVSFVISNNNGKFGFTTNTGPSLTTDLADDLEFDYTNANYTGTNNVDTSVFRLKQSIRRITNKTVPQLTLTLWSGLALHCEIVGENLECILLLPEKYRTSLEGLAGNFNGDPNDDLINRQTNKKVLILSSSQSILTYNDSDVLDACRSWRVYGDNTPDISTPIMPRRFVDWYYGGASIMLADANPLLNETIVNQTCSTHFECIHDYLIRTNSFTSKTTALALTNLEESRRIFAEMPPKVNLISPVKIIYPINKANRSYVVPIVIGADNEIDITSIHATIYPDNITMNIPIVGGDITIPIPNNIASFVDVLLTVNFGTNSTWQKYFDIIVCLCTNDGTCNFQETTHITSHYQIASCDCPPQFDGDLCEYNYSACASPSACTLHWNNQTTCISLSPTEQQLQNRSYYCNGTCINGYHSTDDYTCEDVDECQSDPSICRHGPCINLPGSFTCNCTSGYRFHNQTCVDINECNEPNIDGSFSRRCPNDVDVCVNNDGSYECECSAIFNTTGTCTYNASLCLNDTCTDNESGLVVCLHGTVNVNNKCVPWCDSTCAGFCDQINDTYQCNCMKYVGYELSNDGQRCVECRDLSYGYGCRETCECNHGVCNRNATHVNESCMCDVGYRAPNCVQLIDACGSASKCNNMTEDCTTDAQNGSAICVCKNGYERSATSDVCIDVDECVQQADNCDGESSKCVNTVGSYVCSCKDGYKNMSGSCVDIDECVVSLMSCRNYANTYCANIKGSYECRCKYGYSMGGNKANTFENILNTSNLCLPTDCSMDCAKACSSPADCDATTCECKCPLSVMNLVSVSNSSKETCECPGYPFVNYTKGMCDSSIAQTWLLAEFDGKSMVRAATIRLSHMTILKNEISNIITEMNRTCDALCVQVSEVKYEAISGYFIALNLSLNATERLKLVNGLFNKNTIMLNNTSIRMIINDKTKKLETFSDAVRRCRECELLDRGSCLSESEDTCRCYSDYEGYFCRIESSTKEPDLRISEDRKWIIVVGVISAIAGLLLILAIFMCIIRVISNFRRITPKMPRQSIGQGTYSIPRAYVPIMGTVGQDIMNWDGFSLSTNDGHHNETSDTYPSSSSTTFNPTYHIDGSPNEADFTIFDNLDKHAPLSKASIPRAQMIGMTGTLNSFPRDRIETPIGAFLDSNELNETELVTEMLEEMTKDDDLADEFIEAHNPNIMLPRITEQTETIISSRFPYFWNS